MKILHPLRLTAILSLSLVAGPDGAFAQNPGSLDLSFDPGVGANSSVLATAVQSDGRIMIGGHFDYYSGTWRKHIARLHSDGSLDETFAPGTGTSSYVTAIAVQNDGKIVIGGYFSSYDGTPRNGIARLNEDGSLDTTFDPGAGVSGGAPETAVQAIAIQSDGKIVIGGLFTWYDGTPTQHISRLNENGSLDTTFGGEVISDVYAIAIQNDGKIVIAGTFNNKIARLNVDGSLDAAFDPGSGVGGSALNALALQADQRAIIGGYFWSYNGTSRSNIARVNANGTLDTTFDPGAGANGNVSTTTIQSDGRIIIGGGFTSYDGTPRNRIARLNADGSLDIAFDPGGGTNNGILTTTILNDGRIIIGGYFIFYNGTARNRIARLHGDGTVGIDNIYSHELYIFPNPASSSVSVVISEQLGRSELLLRNAFGQEMLRSTMAAGRNELPLHGLAPGVYAVEFGAPGIRRTQRLLVQ